MLTKTVFLAIGLGSAAAVASPAYLSHVQLSGDCRDSHLEIRLDDDGYHYIGLEFNDEEMTATATVAKTSDKRRCNIDFNVDLKPGFRLDVFEFSVDGDYELSERGSATLNVKHKIAQKTVASAYSIFKVGPGGPYGDFVNYAGTVYRHDLPKLQYKQCGASIPLRTSIIAKARRHSLDDMETTISLDDGGSKSFTKLCKIVPSPCP